MQNCPLIIYQSGSLIPAERREPKDTVQGEGVELKKTVGECSGMVGGDQHGDSESWTGGARYDNMKEASWGQGDMVVER